MKNMSALVFVVVVVVSAAATAVADVKKIREPANRMES